MKSGCPQFQKFCPQRNPAALLPGVETPTVRWSSKIKFCKPEAIRPAKKLGGPRSNSTLRPCKGQVVYARAFECVVKIYPVKSGCILSDQMTDFRFVWDR